MPKRSKLNLERIRESLNTPCPYCDYSIPPSEIRRVDTENMICPKCSSIFIQLALTPDLQHLHVIILYIFSLTILSLYTGSA